MGWTELEILQAIHETIMIVGGLGVFGLGMLVGLKLMEVTR